jgi:hypothetical protein
MEKNNNSTSVGIKHDQKKLRWDLLPIEPVESVIKVMMLGSGKYSDDNWMHIEDPLRRYYSAAMRHITAWQKGEKIDSESGESHLAHAACCMLFMLWHEKNENFKQNK